MTRAIVWSDEALDDFDSAITIIAIDSKRPASLVADRIEAAIETLATMPAGRPGRVAGMYETPVTRTRYIIAYSLSDHAIRIVRIVHGSRNWPEGEWPAE